MTRSNPPPRTAPSTCVGGCTPSTGWRSALCPARWVAFGLLAAAAACGGAPQPRGTAPGTTALVLPAAVMTSPEAAYCATKGGQVRPEPLPGGGIRAMCFLPDHRIAEIGALYRVEVVDRL